MKDRTSSALSPRARQDCCDKCGKRIKFIATKAGELPDLEFCSALCMDRYRAQQRVRERERT